MTKAQQAVQVERYEQFFGLHEPPFSLAPNPRYLFESASHAGALAQMAYAIERREPLVVITGEIGTGKTLLCRTVLDRLERKTFVSIINNPLLERDDLLNQLLQDFGVISKNRTIAAAASRHDLVHALEDFLTSLIALDAHAVVIIDEAQHVQPDVLEQIRLLSNIGDARGTMLAIILVGQPDLESVLSRPELRQVQQRVSRRIRLEPLTVAELPLYIDHRLTVGRTARSQMPGASELAHAIAEWEGSGAAVTFIPDAVEAIWKWSSGLPRVINLLCDRALEAACARRLRAVDAAAIDAAAASLDLRGQPEAVAVSPIPQPVNAGEVERIPHAFEAASTRARARTRALAALTAVLAFATVAAWLTVRGSSGSGADQPAAIRQNPASIPPPPAVRSEPPRSEPTTAPAPAGAPPTPASAPASRGATAAAGETTSDRFDIIVASFRTEARAASVATQVADVGLPVRQRFAGGWQQVVAGPFASRGEADAAQQRLTGAGLTDTHVVPASR